LKYDTLIKRKSSIGISFLYTTDLVSDKRIRGGILMQTGIYFDQTRCTGCYTCLIACKDWHDVEVGGAVDWIKIREIVKGKYPSVSVSYLFMTCLHCADPLCVPACPVKAITKRNEDGIVTVDREACLGGQECKFACQKACPYDMPQFGPEQNPKMQKCDLCLERWATNKDPICVAACPMRALDAGPLDQQKARYGDVQEAEGFVYSQKLKPSVVFKPKFI